MAQFSVMQRSWKPPWIFLLGYGKHYGYINTGLYPDSWFVSQLSLLAYRKCCVNAKGILFHSNLFRIHLPFLGHHILLSRLSKSGWKEKKKLLCGRWFIQNKLNSLHPLWKVSTNGNAKCNYLPLILIVVIIFQEVGKLMCSEEEESVSSVVE